MLTAVVLRNPVWTEVVPYHPTPVNHCLLLLLVPRQATQTCTNVAVWRVSPSHRAAFMGECLPREKWVSGMATSWQGWKKNIGLMHWDLNKMPAVKLWTAVWNLNFFLEWKFRIFSWVKIFAFWLKFHPSNYLDQLWLIMCHRGYWITFNMKVFWEMKVQNKCDRYRTINDSAMSYPESIANFKILKLDQCEVNRSDSV